MRKFTWLNCSSQMGMGSFLLTAGAPHPPLPLSSRWGVKPRLHELLYGSRPRTDLPGWAGNRANPDPHWHQLGIISSHRESGAVKPLIKSPPPPLYVRRGWTTHHVVIINIRVWRCLSGTDQTLIIIFIIIKNTQIIIWDFHTVGFNVLKC